jgi:hypothetical protein
MRAWATGKTVDKSVRITNGASGLNTTSEGRGTTKPNRRPALYEDFAKAMVLRSPIEGQRSMIEDCVKVVVLRREGKNLWER